MEISYSVYVCLCVVFMLSPFVLKRLAAKNVISDIVVNFLLVPFMIFISWGVLFYKSSFKLLVVVGDRETIDTVSFFTFVMLVLSVLVISLRKSR